VTQSFSTQQGIAFAAAAAALCRAPPPPTRADPEAVETHLLQPKTRVLQTSYATDPRCEPQRSTGRHQSAGLTQAPARGA
jgi:hypothetical protein